MLTGGGPDTLHDSPEFNLEEVFEKRYYGLCSDFIFIYHNCYLLGLVQCDGCNKNEDQKLLLK